MNGWQEPVALFVVAATVALFIRKAFRSRKRAGMCGSDCACPAAEERPLIDSSERGRGASAKTASDVA
jgi:hypothetical protein